jgi:protein MAK11
MTLIHTIKHPSRIHQINFCRRVQGAGEVLLVGAEDKKVTVYSVPSSMQLPFTVIGEMIGHTNRIKAIQTLPIGLPRLPSPSSRESTTVVCTVSSDGNIHIYDLADLPLSETNGIGSSPAQVTEMTPIAQYDTKGTRLTCLTVVGSDLPNPLYEDLILDKKRKPTISDSEEEGGDNMLDGDIDDTEIEDETREEELQETSDSDGTEA